jgi:hypothetical protein
VSIFSKDVSPPPNPRESFFQSFGSWT